MDNKGFTLTFGKMPSNYIERGDVAEKIKDMLSFDYPLSHSVVITGVRGSGKTVLLTKVAKMMSAMKEWIVVDVNPKREVLSQVAAGLYESKRIKQIYLKSSISLSFKGFGITIEGKQKASNIETVVAKLLDIAVKKGLKVLITLDEAANNPHMRSFLHDYQALLRDDYPLYLLMTGLNENVFSLKNSKSLTFLYRCPKIELGPLDLKLIKEEYEKAFDGIGEQEAADLSNLTKGYAFAYQVVGILYAKYRDLNKMIGEFDQYMSLFVYDKIWESLPENERKVLFAFSKENEGTASLRQKAGLGQKEFSVYRDRLLRRGLLDGSKRGQLSFVLPRFFAFVARQID